jgi:tRNA A-37 threonylcarbamoyl transferase component Bud32
MSDPLELPGVPPKSDTSLDFIPERIGSYTIHKLIGKGGMGTVYEAEQAHPHRRVAVKLMRADRLSEASLRRFTVESEVLGRLQHVGIAQIYEAGTAVTPLGTQPFFAMELIEGRPLDQYVAQKKLGIRDCLRMMAKVADAVHHAHQQGVVHRDLKPVNIIVDGSGQPKILDFGVARVIGTEPPDTAARTEVGTLVGTLLYMSPEQTESEPGHVDARSDVYTLGVIAYELLAGRLPYDLPAANPIEAIRVIREEEPVRLSTINRSLRGDVETVLAKALEKERARRYQSAREFAHDINQLVEARPIQARPRTISSKIIQWSMREERIRQAGLAGVSMCVGVGLFEAFWALSGIAVLLGAPAYGPQIRPVEFIVHCLSWALIMAGLAWLNWGAMRRRVQSIWLAVISSTVLFVFTVLVGANVLPYDFGGALADVKVRTLMFSFWIPMAFVGVVLNCLALIALYRLRQWQRTPWNENTTARSRVVGGSGADQT